MYIPYVETYVPFGNKSACSFDPKGKPGDIMIEYETQCAQGMKSNTGKSRGYQAAIGISVISTVTLVILVCCIICCKARHNCSSTINKYEIIYGQNNNPNGRNDKESIEPSGQEQAN